MATLPSGKEVLVMVTNPSMEIFNEPEFPVAGGVSASATWMVNVEVPRVVGIPEIVAVLSGFPVSVSPAGRVPLLTLHV
jgi:hypothetical protein